MRFIPEDTNVYYPSNYGEVTNFYLGDFWYNDDDNNYNYPLFYNGRIVIRYYLKPENGKTVRETWTKENRKTIEDAMKVIESACCLHFMETTPYVAQRCQSQNKWIIEFHRIRKADEPCSADLGRQPDIYTRLFITDNCENDKSLITHELFHVLGFIHEHQRPDRDQYVKILTENIQRGQGHNFDKRGPNAKFGMNLTDPYLTYDLESIMHYGEMAYSVDRNNKKTVVPLGSKIQIGNYKFSATDAQKLNFYYGCHRYENIYWAYKAYGNTLFYDYNDKFWGIKMYKPSPYRRYYVNEKSEILKNSTSAWREYPIKGCVM